MKHNKKVEAKSRNLELVSGLNGFLTNGKLKNFGLNAHGIS